jgi:tetratricopeptide (TPR) repeat protein
LTLVDPLALSPKTVEEVQGQVGFWGTDTERMRRLMRYLVDDDRVHFQYALNHSLTAQEAYEERRGDCVAYTNLYVALARALGISARFARLSERPAFYDRDDALYVSTHMAVTARAQFGTLLVDFSHERSTPEVDRFEDTNDEDAFALYYNNVAMDAFVKGDSEGAERTLRFFVQERPKLQELWANLGIVLMHEGRFKDALGLDLSALKRFPENLRLYTHAAEAAHAAGQEELAQSLLAKAVALPGSDPAFLFDRGLALYSHQSYQKAAEDFRHAARSLPNNVVILTWMVRAFLAAGDSQEGLKTYHRLARVAPQSHWLSQLQAQFPWLSGT